MRTNALSRLVGSVFGVILLALLVLFGGPARTEAGPESEPHRLGITLLASDIGDDLAVADLLAFVEQARIREVIVDWAWITLHWDGTDFGAVQELVTALEKHGVRVAAMYRPRFKPHEIDAHRIAYQVDGEGEPLGGACEIRYADADARAWGTAWAVKILERCPAFGEVIVYNPSQRGLSADLVAGRAADPAFDQACVRGFLAETRSAMRRVAQNTRLGLVLPPDLASYEPFFETVDVVRPFVFVREGVDFARDWERAVEVLDATGKAGPALAKITWAQGEAVTDEQLSTFLEAARAHGRPFVLWTFWTAFCEGHYDLDRLCAALGLDAVRIRRCVRDLGGRSGLPSDPAVVAKAVREAADDTTAQAYPRMLAVARRYGSAAVAPLCSLLGDPKETAHARWRAAGALGSIGSSAAVPALLEASRDGSATVRLLCAEALGKCGLGSEAAHTRLLDMAASDTARRLDRKTGAVVHYVRKTACTSLERLMLGGPVDADILERTVAVVVVKDFLRLESTGPRVERVIFPRYFPAVDHEQIVLGRWATAKTDEGAPVPIELAGVQRDPGGNEIHTWRVAYVPDDTGVVATVTSLVLRRDRQQPEGPHPIPAPETYPDAVRPYLQSTPCVVVDHPVVREMARRIRAATDDAWDVAVAIAAHQEANTYKPRSGRERGLPTSAAVLEYGGSCCGSAVGAAALFRACGIPARITYVPAGYIHGIVEFWLADHGWCRMDATSGVGRLPLVVKGEHRGLVRLYDMPIEMEQRPGAYAWPFHHNTVDGDYLFRIGDGEIAPIRFAARDAKEARREGRVEGRVAEPFHHLEPGSWHAILRIEDWRISDAAWKRLGEISLDAVRAGRVGWFGDVARKLRPYADAAWFAATEARLHVPPMR